MKRRFIRYVLDAYLYDARLRLAELKLGQHALRLYRARDWDLAELQMYNLSQRAPGCRLYVLYAESIVAWRASAPDDSWNGSTNYQTK